MTRDDIEKGVEKIAPAGFKSPVGVVLEPRNIRSISVTTYHGVTEGGVRLTYEIILIISTPSPPSIGYFVIIIDSCLNHLLT